MGKRIVAVVGTYRKGHIIDSSVDVVLEYAKQNGAEVEKIDLLDKHIEFCTNCRACTQEKLDALRGKCVLDDDVEDILSKIDAADAFILASPINFSSVTALMKRFVERMIAYSYWPWDSSMPKGRVKGHTKKAVVVTASGCPAFIGRFLLRNAGSMLKFSSKVVGAKKVKKVYLGGVAVQEDQKISEKQKGKLEKAARFLLN